MLHYQPQQLRPTVHPVPAWSRNRLAEDAENPETVGRVPLYRMRPYVLIMNILELGPVRFRRILYGASTTGMIGYLCDIGIFVSIFFCATIFQVLICTFRTHKALFMAKSASLPRMQPKP